MSNVAAYSDLFLSQFGGAFSFLHGKDKSVRFTVYNKKYAGKKHTSQKKLQKYVVGMLSRISRNVFHEV